MSYSDDLMETYWKTSKRKICYHEPLVMAILNVTPDSFSDGGRYRLVDEALRRAEKLVSDGADILDIGGESTRPNSKPVTADEEMSRVLPVIGAIAERFDIPISIDTTKSRVAESSVAAGAEIVNDISGLRFDPEIGNIAAQSGAGLVLMHSRGTFETMHSEPPVADVIADVIAGLGRSLAARQYDVIDEQIVLDVGIGFGKTLIQNLELIAKLDTIANEFPGFPILAGTSRKSFIGKILGEPAADERLTGSLVTAAIAVWNGARVVRVHDVKPTVEAIKIAFALDAAR